MLHLHTFVHSPKFALIKEVFASGEMTRPCLEEHEELQKVL